MKQAKVLNTAELKRVLVVAASGKHGQRNRLAVLLSHYAGLRVGEIASLKWQQVLEVDGSVKSEFYLNASDTKSNEARAVYLNPTLQNELFKYKRSVWPLNGSTRSLSVLFVIGSQKRKGFSANSLCQLFGRLYALAGIDGASSHSGRRWFITNLAHKGVSAKVIMELAGHKNLGTTQRYIEVNAEMKKQAVSLL